MSAAPTLPPALAHDRRALVAIDLGAESCRVSLLRSEPAGFTATLVHRFPNEPVSSPSGLHWPLKHIERGVHEGLSRCAELAPEGIRSIAVDGWAVDYVRLSKEGTPLGAPFCYRDERTLAAEQTIHAHTSAATLRELTGVQIQRINTAYQLVADRLAGKAPARWLNLPEYLLYRLGGSAVAELTNASHTQLIGLDGTDGCMGWSSEAFRLLGLDPSLAAPVVPPGTLVGQLRGELATLPAFRNTTLIAPACHDTASAIAGIPADEYEGDWAYISSGTWSLVGTVLNAPENGAAACAGNYTNLAAAGGRTLFHKGLHGMWLLRQCMLHWATEAGHAPQLATLIEQAAHMPPPEHLLQADDPELLLHGNMPQRISDHIVQHGGRALPQTHTAATTYASLIFHSLAAWYATVLSDIEGMTGKHFRRIYVVGGGSRNHLLNRFITRFPNMKPSNVPADLTPDLPLPLQRSLKQCRLSDALRGV